MQTCVPVEKRSKKAQRAAVRANRVLWQGVKLCPRIMRKKTDYSRKARLYRTGRASAAQRPAS